MLLIVSDIAIITEPVSSKDNIEHIMNLGFSFYGVSRYNVEWTEHKRIIVITIIINIIIINNR